MYGRLASDQNIQVSVCVSGAENLMEERIFSSRAANRSALDSESEAI